MREEIIVSGRMNHLIDPNCTSGTGKFRFICSLEDWLPESSFLLRFLPLWERRKSIRLL